MAASSWRTKEDRRWLRPGASVDPAFLFLTLLLLAVGAFLFYFCNFKNFNV